MKAGHFVLCLCGVFSALHVAAPNAAAFGDEKPLVATLTAKKSEREKTKIENEKRGVGQARAETYTYNATLQSNVSDPISGVKIVLYLVGELYRFEGKDNIPAVVNVIESPGLQLGPQEIKQVEIGSYTFETRHSEKATGGYTIEVWMSGESEYGYIAEVFMGNKLIDTLYGRGSTGKLKDALEAYKANPNPNSGKKKKKP